MTKSYTYQEYNPDADNTWKAMTIQKRTGRQDWNSGEGGLNFPTKLFWKGSAVGFVNSTLIFYSILHSTVYAPTVNPNI